MFYTVKNSLGSNWPQRTPMRTSCVQDIKNISACEFYVFPVVPGKLEKVMKYEVKIMMSFIFLETLNIEWGQIDPKGNRRVKTVQVTLAFTEWVLLLEAASRGRQRPVLSGAGEESIEIEVAQLRPPQQLRDCRPIIRLNRLRGGIGNNWDCRWKIASGAFTGMLYQCAPKTNTKHISN